MELPLQPFALSLTLLCAALAAGCHTPAQGASSAVSNANKDGVLVPSRAFAMPAGPGPLHTDYIVYDAPTHAVWIPTGTTPRVDVFDTVAQSFRSVTPFPTQELVTPAGRRFVVGVSSATVGEGVVYVGNRADRRLCAVDLRSLAVGNCVTLDAMPDGLVYAPGRRELWATTPRTNGLAVVRAEAGAPMTAVATIPLQGEPEGYAVDNVRGVFFTNLKDRDQTVGFDMATRRLVSTWSPGCGEGGARGLIIDTARHFLFVACHDHTVTLDMAHDGARVGNVAAGDGVDDMGYWPERGLLYVTSSTTGMLRFVRVGPHGELRVVAHANTAPSARNAVVDEHGRAYVVDSLTSRLFVVEPPPP